MNSRKPGAAADGDNRSRLLHAASDVFAEFGYEGASLRAIADSADVSFRLIAYYFGSKEELWVATVDYLFERYFETGKGLGFTPSGNLDEQFHNHLRLLLTDMLQRPQLHKICVQEHLANSARFRNIIAPKHEELFTTLALPYFQEVVRLGIVERFTAEEICFLWSSICKANVASPDFVEYTLGLSPSSPKAIEQQVDLAFAILTEKLDAQASAVEPPVAPVRAARASEPAADTVVYAWKDSKDGATEASRTKQLEMENLHLKQLIGNLSLEKQLLLDRSDTHGFARGTAREVSWEVRKAVPMTSQIEAALATPFYVDNVLYHAIEGFVPGPPWVKAWKFNGWQAESLSWKRACYIHAGLSNTGPISIKGPDAERYLQGLVINSFAKFPVGTMKHGVACTPDGLIGVPRHHRAQSRGRVRDVCNAARNGDGEGVVGH